MKGHILVPRAVLGRMAARPYDRLSAWLWLVARAAFRTYTDAGGETKERGTLATSQYKLACEWGWSPKKVRRFLCDLREAGDIVFETDTNPEAGGTRITILNYEQYQGACPSRAPHQTPMENTDVCPSTRPSPAPVSAPVPRPSNYEGKEPLLALVDAPESAPKEVRSNVEKNPLAGAEANGGQFWGQWVDANTRAGRVNPVSAGPDTKAAKELAKLLPQEKWPDVLSAFLADTDQFLQKQGHALRLLPGRVNGYLNGTNGSASNDEAAEKLAAQLRRKVKAGERID